MKILTAEQTREADTYTIQNEPISSTNLMERAASACSEWIARHFQKERPVKVFCGIGNNGGDGLVIARLLSKKGYPVTVYIVRFSKQSSPDFKINEKRLARIKSVNVKEIRNKKTIPALSENDIVIDAVLGSGLSRPVEEGLVADVIYHINRQHATVIAIDIPSGLFCDKVSGKKPRFIIEASITLSFQLPKLAFMFSENHIFVGEWQILPIGLDREFINKLPCKNHYITGEIIKDIYRPRSKFTHKGNYGHALLIAGSYGKMGAAVLATKACLKAGAGLLTTHIPKKGYSIIQTAVPEAMAEIDSSDTLFGEVGKLEKYNAIGVGPGIGTDAQTTRALKVLIQQSKIPLVIDADAINIIAENKTWLSFIPTGSIYTPHPKEFERLVGKSTDSFERQQMQIRFANKYGVYIVLKGAHTTIACPDGKCYFNSTGNPGMATAGSGDVLTGIILGLMAQGYNPREACIMGAYLHGLAGDLAASQESEESITATDIVLYLGKGFKII